MEGEQTGMGGGRDTCVSGLSHPLWVLGTLVPDLFLDSNPQFGTVGKYLLSTCLQVPRGGLCPSSIGSRAFWGYVVCHGLPSQSGLSPGLNEVLRVPTLPHLLPLPLLLPPPSLFNSFRPSFSATLAPVTVCCGRATRKAWWRRPWRCSSFLRARSVGPPAWAPGEGRDGGTHKSLACRGTQCQSQPGCHKEIACLLSPREMKHGKVRGRGGEGNWKQGFCDI